MLKNIFSDDEKKIIATKIKNISFETVEREMNKLIEIRNNSDSKILVSSISRIGNNIVDYFTFVQRLETKGKYDINFFDFIINIEEFKKKKFIQNMITYYEDIKNKNKTKNEYIVLKEIYNICISPINIIRPIVYMEIYSKYNPQCILDFCAGWGGATIAASVLNIPNYIGIEINTDLKEPYNKLTTYLKTKSDTYVNMIFNDCLKIDYSKLNYDFVFTSPPYYFIQKYANNFIYNSKQEMNEKFYKPIFTNTFNGLNSGGYYIINICKEVYNNVLIQLLGEADDIYPYNKSKRQNDYKEIIYVWKKHKNLICST